MDGQTKGRVSRLNQLSAVGDDFDSRGLSRSLRAGNFSQAGHVAGAQSCGACTREGWAHYTEQMMIEEGFGGGDPKIRMGQLADALLRLCRFEVGKREHTLVG